MVLGCILPVAWYRGKIHFLFGKECELEDSAPGWSDFGGGCEDCTDTDTVSQRAQKIFNTAVREGVEESTGFLGTQKSITDALHHTATIASCIRKQIPDTKYSEYESLSRNELTTFFMPIQYDPLLPAYYNRNHALLWSEMDHSFLNKTKLFEKSEIGWFTESDLRRRRNEFRWFYRDIVDLILLRANTPHFRYFVRQIQTPKPGRITPTTSRGRKRIESKKMLKRGGKRFGNLTWRN